MAKYKEQQNKLTCLSPRLPSSCVTYTQIPIPFQTPSPASPDRELSKSTGAGCFPKAKAERGKSLCITTTILRQLRKLARRCSKTKGNVAWSGLWSQAQLFPSGGGWLLWGYHFLYLLLSRSVESLESWVLGATSCYQERTVFPSPILNTQTVFLNELTLKVASI